MLTPYELASRIQKDSIMKKVGKDVDYNVENLNGIITISFQGSNSFRDYWNDVLFFKKRYKIGNQTFRIHKGFLKVWLSAKEFVLADITRAEQETVTGYQITGHSLGAALALLCFLDLRADFKTDNVDVTTFGCPRVFGLKNRKVLRQIFAGARLFRNGSDLVSHLPYHAWGFFHVTKVLHIGDKNNPLGYFRVLKEHGLKYYKKTLEKIIYG